MIGSVGLITLTASPNVQFPSALSKVTARSDQRLSASVSPCDLLPKFAKLFIFPLQAFTPPWKSGGRIQTAKRLERLNRSWSRSLPDWRGARLLSDCQPALRWAKPPIQQPCCCHPWQTPIGTLV